MTWIAVDLIASLAAINLARSLTSLVFPASAETIVSGVGLGATVLLIAIQAALGVYRVPRPGPCAALRLRVQAIIILAGAGLVGGLASGGMAVSLLWAAVSSGLLVTFGFYGARLAEWALGQAGLRGAPTAIVGTDETARAVAAGLLANPDLGLRPIGFIALADQPAIGIELPLPLLGRLDHADAIAPLVDVCVLPMALREREVAEAALGRLPFERIMFLKDLAAVRARRLEAVHVSDLAVSLLPGAMMPRLARALRRAADLAVAVPLAAIALPFVLLFALAVRLADPGRALYVQSRAGLNERPFDVLKIRTMYLDAEQRLERCLAEDPALAEEWRGNFKLARDPRILPGIGHLLRRLSLDELPQLWNVIRGDMSLIGPRPFPFYHLKSFDPDFRALRASVVPGLTGLWQISARSDGDLSAQKEQDSLYIAQRSPWLDLLVLLETAPAVLSTKGAR